MLYTFLSAQLPGETGRTPIDGQALNLVGFAVLISKQVQQ